MDSLNNQNDWKQLICKGHYNQILFASISQYSLPERSCPFGRSQCVAMAAASIVYSRICKDPSKWTKCSLDKIVKNGNSFYTSTMNRLILDDAKKKELAKHHNHIWASDLNCTGTLYERTFMLEIHSKTAHLGYLTVKNLSFRPLHLILNVFFNEEQHKSGIIIDTLGFARALFKCNQKYYIFDSHSVCESKAALIECCSIESLSSQFVSLAVGHNTSQVVNFDLTPIDCSFRECGTLLSQSIPQYSGNFLPQFNYEILQF